LESRIQIVQKAVFSSSGELLLRLAKLDRGHGNASILVNEGGSSETLRVPSITVDAFAASNPPPSLVKIDVEGAESEVLAGAESTLKDHRPLVLCEVHDQANANLILPWLEQRGFQWQWLEINVAYPRHLCAAPVGTME
jgi:FkbM family methyltransferase